MIKTSNLVLLVLVIIIVLIVPSCKKEYVTPTLNTLPVNSITYTSAISGGEISDNGGSPVTARGVCWSTSRNPSLSNSFTSDASGSERFVSNIINLEPGTTYYVRAYATNKVGTDYGDEKIFQTLGLEPPTVTTAEVSGVTAGVAVSGGNISDNGGDSVTARGVCWSTSQNPTTADSTTHDGSGSGGFTSTITNLTASTKYYVRAYAVNSAGTSYGNEVSFTTAGITAPVISTKELTNVTSSSLTTGGNITDNGGSNITSRGVCWSTDENPTTSDNVIETKSESLDFSTIINGLTDGTVYYIRAFATNSAGSSYGNQVTVITPVTDIEGNVYKTVLIGTQVWMAENLKTTKFNDNSSIQNITGNAEWLATHAPAISWFDNNISNKNVYGALYNWYAVSSGRLCPQGWHEPSDTDFNTLEITLGMPSSEIYVYGFRGTDQGTQVKGTTTWDASGNGTNSSGFNVLAYGYREWTTGQFWGLGTFTYFWTTSDDAVNGHPENGWYRRLDSVDPRIYRGTTLKEGGKYVRCVKD